MKLFLESLLCAFVSLIGLLVRLLPVSAALFIGRALGLLAYYVDRKHKALAYGNLKIAFSREKKPSEIKRIVKQLFKNYAQNFIELLRIPLLKKGGFKDFVQVDGREHVYEALKKQKGVILLAMHFGSWELSNFMGEMLGHPYRVLAKPQNRFSGLDRLLNSYRESSGSSVILRGVGTREIITSLRNNEVIGMVVDQGGRDGALVKFFDRQAAMSVGAIRIGLKLKVPICFSIIVREKGAQHRLIINPEIELINTGDIEKDVAANLEKIVKLMESYIRKYPSEYMWFYKIWKYSKESTTIVLSDGKTGHLRQSQAVAKLVDAALAQRDIVSQTQIVEVRFKNTLAAKMATLLGSISHQYFCQGRLRYLKWFLTYESFRKISSIKADFVISCGSSIAGVNFLLSSDCRAKNISILKPSVLDFKKFRLVILPAHDRVSLAGKEESVVITQGALNLIDRDYLKEQIDLLGKRFKGRFDTNKLRISVLIGGDSRKYAVDEGQVRMLIGQLKEACEKLDAEILLTTSRRTSIAAENIIRNELQNYNRCRLLIFAKENNIPEALGGMVGLSDIVITSGDSISMVSEAASSGKNVIVFPARKKPGLLMGKSRHDYFVENLSDQGYIVLSDEKNIGRVITDMAKGKLKTKILDERRVVFEVIKKII
ncbi:MAG: ELM1/GtrOC1 family putative glycosyltransferase [Candidatus Omnitrophota bacterium]